MKDVIKPRQHHWSQSLKRTLNGCIESLWTIPLAFYGADRILTPTKCANAVIGLCSNWIPKLRSYCEVWRKMFYLLLFLLTPCRGQRRDDCNLKWRILDFGVILSQYKLRFIWRWWTHKQRCPIRDSNPGPVWRRPLQHNKPVTIIDTRKEWDKWIPSSGDSKILMLP